MNRRQFSVCQLSVLLGISLGIQPLAMALSLGDITNAQASQGLKLALEKGAVAAVQSLGQTNGFMGNDKVRIPLPGHLGNAVHLLRSLGQGARLDELVAAMNHAAEEAVPLAQDMLLKAVKSMNVQDAKSILSGGDTSVTQFFIDKTRLPLGQKFLPVVTKVTSRVNLAGKYNQVAGKAAEMGLIERSQATIEQYVTGKALDGLYLMIGEEEKKIRNDPIGTGSALLQKVFGALHP
jgi:hypothetical protein